MRPGQTTRARTTAGGPQYLPEDIQRGYHNEELRETRGGPEKTLHADHTGSEWKLVKTIDNIECTVRLFENTSGVIKVEKGPPKGSSTGTQRVAAESPRAPRNDSNETTRLYDSEHRVPCGSKPLHPAWGSGHDTKSRCGSRGDKRSEVSPTMHGHNEASAHRNCLSETELRNEIAALENILRDERERIKKLDEELRDEAKDLNTGIDEYNKWKEHEQSKADSDIGLINQKKKEC